MELIQSNTEKRRRFARQFSRKVITYVVVCSFLLFVNWFSSPHYWWVAWVAAGWGLSLALSLTYYLIDCDDEEDYNNK